MPTLATVSTSTVSVSGASGAVPRIQSDDRVINQLQSNIIPKVNQLVANPITQGVLLQKVTLVSGDNVVPHGLGRPMLGWVTTRIRANAASLYDTNDTTSNANTSFYLYINASAGVVCDLYIF